jgi:hypothetical protein
MNNHSKARSRRPLLAGGGYRVVKVKRKDVALKRNTIGEGSDARQRDEKHKRTERGGLGTSQVGEEGNHKGFPRLGAVPERERGDSRV